MLVDSLFGSIITSFALQRRLSAAEDGSSGLGRLSMVGCVPDWPSHSLSCVGASATTLVPPKPFPFLLPLRIGFGKNYFLQANAKKCISRSDEQMLCCQCQGVSRHQRTFPFIAKIGHTAGRKRCYGASFSKVEGVQGRGGSPVSDEATEVVAMLLCALMDILRPWHVPGWDMLLHAGCVVLGVQEAQQAPGFPRG